MKLMRQQLRDALGRQPNAPHAGLWLARGWAEFVKASGEGGDHGKAAHLDLLYAQKPSRLYELAYARWRQVTDDNNRFRSLYALLPQRLFIGLSSSASAIETGVCTSYSYGMPMIPGSSVKGAARAHAKAIGVPAEYLAVLFGENDTAACGSARLPGAGTLVWHDAWWIPQGGVQPFVAEIVTVHHQSYYGGNGEATDFDSPVPNAQVAVKGSFHFVVEGDPAWSAMAVNLLRSALEKSGIGAKRAAGYGLMVEDAKAAAKAQREREELLKKELGPADSIRMDLLKLEDVDEARLAKQLNAAIRECPQEHQPLLRAIGLELYGEKISSWSGETNKTNKEKARTYKFFMS